MSEYVYPKSGKDGWAYPHPLRVIALMTWDAIKAVFAAGVLTVLLYLFFTHLAWFGCLVLGVIIVVTVFVGVAWFVTKVRDWYDDAWGRLMLKKKNRP